MSLQKKAQREFRQVYRDARPYLHSQGPAPKLSIKGGNVSKGGPGGVSLTRDAARSLANEKGYGRGVALHELAHTAQKANVATSSRKAEGGAEIFAKKLVDRLYGAAFKPIYDNKRADFRDTYGKKGWKNQF